MSRFLDQSLQALKPYVPGEQPQDKAYIKLNTNESPFPPPKGVINAVYNASKDLNLYCDPSCTALRQRFAQYYDISADNIVFGNGSDEILAFCFKAFCQNGVAFPDISYGFYEVFANLNGLQSQIIPLDNNLKICPQDYAGLKKTIVIANPNAPTGFTLNLAEIELILTWNKENLVIIDEAYVDFGAESCVQLTKKYDNLLVVGTFSKSRNLAGARLGYAIGDAQIIADINRVRYSINPYNVNTMTQLAGEASIADDKYFHRCIQKTIDTRQNTAANLREIGFICENSSANFIFAKHPDFSGEELYLRMKEQGVLVRWFNKVRIQDYLRISIGMARDMHNICNILQDVVLNKHR